MLGLVLINLLALVPRVAGFFGFSYSDALYSFWLGFSNALLGWMIEATSSYLPQAPLKWLILTGFVWGLFAARWLSSTPARQREGRSRHKNVFFKVSLLAIPLLFLSLLALPRLAREEPVGGDTLMYMALTQVASSQGPIHVLNHSDHPLFYIILSFVYSSLNVPLDAVFDFTPLGVGTLYMFGLFLFSRRLVQVEGSV